MIFRVPIYVAAESGGSFAARPLFSPPLAALFFLGEYANMIVISAVATTLFLGGWLPPFPTLLPFLSIVPGPIWFALKVFVFLFVYIWFRGTFPRYRFDQLMDLGWKWMIPLALANIFITGLIKLLV